MRARSQRDAHFKRRIKVQRLNAFYGCNGCFGLIAAAMSLDRLSCACNRNTFVGFPPFNLSLLMLVFRVVEAKSFRARAADIL